MEAPEHSWPPGALEDGASKEWHPPGQSRRSITSEAHQARAPPQKSTKPVEAKETHAPAATVVPEAMARRVVLVVATVIVDALCPLLQEHASRGKNFDSSGMVLSETMSYYMGGLVVAVTNGGWNGLLRCLQPARYIAFLPASVAFSASNFLTYVAVKGLGASQFYLLAQLRVAVLAAFLRVWSGARQPLLAWLALLQLAVGTFVLCIYKASAGCGSPGSYDDAANASGHDAPEAGIAASVSAASAQAAEVERAAFVSGIIALAGVVFSSAFGFIYLEWQLKLHSKDPIFVQLHQMNFFGALGALLIYINHNTAAAVAGADAAAAVALDSAGAGNATAMALLDRGAALTSSLVAGMEGNTQEPHVEASSLFPSSARLMMVLIIVSRGTLAATVLKRLDSIAKGLIDVTAIVFCSGLQFGLNELDIDGTIVGIQVLMLLSVCSYLMARASHPTVVNGAARPSGLSGPGSELLEMSLRRLPDPQVLLTDAGGPSKRAV